MIGGYMTQGTEWEQKQKELLDEIDKSICDAKPTLGHSVQSRLFR